MAVERTIVVKGMDKGHHDEGVLAGAVYPGMVIMMKADGTYDQPSVTKTECLKRQSCRIVKEDAYQGKTILQAYSIGDKVFFYVPTGGDHILVLVKSGEDITNGDSLVEEGSGSGLFVEAAGSEGMYRFMAKETVGVLGADTLVKAELL